jgi:TonB family protein
MAFEAFLSDTHRRPRAAAVFGYFTSVAAHAPPLAVFVSTWLTHAFVIGSTGSIPEHNRPETAYHIPLSLVAAARGMAPSGEGPGVGGDDTPAPAGLVGRAGRGSRRGITAPREIKKLPDERDPLQAYLAGFPDAPEDLVNSGDGLGKGTGGRPGTGAGIGIQGPGMGGSGTGATTLGAGLRIAAIPPPPPPKPPSNKSSGGRKSTEGLDPEGGGEDPLAALSADELVPPTPGRPVRPVYISSNLAAYFRTFEHFPSIPESYWRGGQTEYPLMVQVCVTTEGTVSKVNVQQGKETNEDVDQLVMSAIRSWRYRPRIINGYPRPFCHPIKIEYSRRVRAFFR